MIEAPRTSQSLDPRYIDRFLTFYNANHKETSEKLKYGTKDVNHLCIGYKITPKPCRVPGPESKEGTCMFVWECIKSEGTHVGVCVDTFMFGSCCVHNTTTNAITASNLQHHQHQYHQHASSSSSDPLRPTLAEALGNESTRPTLTSLSSFLVTDSSTARPSHHPSETPVSSGGSSRPHKPLSAGSARPLQKRPHAKPTSDHKDRIQTSAVPASSNFWEKGSQSTKRPGSSESWDKGSQSTKRPGSGSSVHWEKGSQSTRKPISSDLCEKGSQSTRRPGSSDLCEKGSQSTRRPGSSELSEKGSQNTRRPGSSELWEKGSQNSKRPGGVWEDSSQNTKKPGHHDSLNIQKTRPESGQHTNIKEKDTTHGSFQSHLQGFKDKVDTGHNTLVIRLPAKEHASSEGEGIRHNRPNNQRPSESRPDDSKTGDADLSVQESIHRPSVNSVDENVSIW